MRVRMTPGSIALLLGGCVAALMLRGAFTAAHRQIGWAIACFIVAAMLAPLVDLLDRHMPRWLALLSSMLGVGILVATVWGAIIVNIQDGLSTLSAEAPKAALSLEGRSEMAKEFRLAERVNSLIDNLRSTTKGQAVGQAVGAAGTYFVCGILTLFFLIYGPKMLRAGVAQFKDERRRARVERRVTAALVNGQRYLLASVAQTIAVGAVVGLTSWALSLPAPFVLGLIAGTVGLIPTLGIVVGGLPAILLAAGLNGWRYVIIILGALLVLQVLEIQVVRKRVDRMSVHVGPALPAIVALLGWEIYGIGGAVYGAAVLVFVIAWLDAAGIDDAPELDPALVDT